MNASVWHSATSALVRPLISQPNTMATKPCGVCRTSSPAAVRASLTSPTKSRPRAELPTTCTQSAMASFRLA